MLAEFERKIADFLKSNDVLCPGAKILLAVSGGADSTALLYAVCTLKAEGLLSADLICAHINHQLRGTDAKLDEDFVISQANSLNLPIITRQVDVRGFARKNKLSIETAARKLRLESLLDIARANSCSWITTAHQKDDNAETVIQRLIRGTGFRGLGGIWPVRAFADDISFVRPLLCVRRDEIIEYLNRRNLKWRIDRTNEDCKYRRNFIRHQLIPQLQQQCKDSVVEQLSQLSQSARRFYNLICDSAEKVWPQLANFAAGKVALNLTGFSNQHPAVKVELVRRSLALLGSGERDLTQEHFGKILRLAEQNVSGSQIKLPDKFAVWREYGNLIFARTEKVLKPAERADEGVSLKIPGRMRFGDYLVEATIFEAECAGMEKFKTAKTQFVERFDLDKVQLPLVIRFRKTGDRFVPLGLASEKKVGKFLTTAKVPQESRQNLLIITDNEKIIWLYPIRISEQTKITAKTQKILQLQITDTRRKN